MAKIAVVDLYFRYPPLGGSSADLYGILCRLNKIHEVTLFVTKCIYSKLFPRRGSNRRVSLPFEVYPIHTNWLSYNFRVFPYKIKEAVENFGADYIFIGDGFQLKPFVAERLLELGVPTFLRIYAYEIICLKGYHLFRNSSLCMNTFFKHSFKCRLCSLRLGEDSHLLELFISLGLLPSYKRLVERILREVSQIIVYNHFTREILSPYNQNIQVTPTGVDNSIFIPQKWDNNKIPTIFMAGRVDDITKGFEVLYRACKLLEERKRTFQLVITGKKRFKEDYITSVGWINHEELPSFYQRSNICVVPSIWAEPFGIVAVEAMACGKPVIASRVGGLKEIVEDGITGFLVPPGDPYALAEKIEVLLDSSNLREKMGKNAREKVEREYSWDKVMEKYYLPLFRG